MNAREKDDFVYALGQTMEFYGKELEDRDFAFWYRALAEFPIERIKHALLEHVKVGKYAPRPGHIVELIGEVRKPIEQRETPALPTTDCPPETAAAWRWFIGMHTKGSNVAMYQRESQADEQLQERYLHIVNHEAKRFDMPDAIPDEFKLREVWG